MEPVESPSPDLHRITTIGDSVFAVALTLLAFNVKLPSSADLQDPTFRSLEPFLRDCGAIALSFCVASVFWVGHWLYLRRVVRTSVTFLICNLVVMLSIVLLPIATRLLSSAPLTVTSALVYGGNLLFASLAELAFRREALKLSAPLNIGLSATRFPRLLPVAIAAAWFGLALLAAFVNPWISFWMWIGAFALPLVEVTVRNRNGRPSEHGDANVVSRR